MIGFTFYFCFITIKCGCNSLVPVHWTNEFTTSSLGPIHYDQVKSLGVPFVVMFFKNHNTSNKIICN
jgi:hypothetical protein